MDAKSEKPRREPVPVLPELRQCPGKRAATKGQKVIAIVGAPA